MNKIWQCKIGQAEAIPSGADLPMRQAVAAAYREITGQDCDYIFSGWGASLTEPERAVVENRLPAVPKYDISDIPDPAAYVAAMEHVANEADWLCRYREHATEWHWDELAAALTAAHQARGGE